MEAKASSRKGYVERGMNEASNTQKQQKAGAEAKAKRGFTPRKEETKCGSSSDKQEWKR